MPPETQAIFKGRDGEIVSVIEHPDAVIVMLALPSAGRRPGLQSEIRLENEADADQLVEAIEAARDRVWRAAELAEDAEFDAKFATMTQEEVDAELTEAGIPVAAWAARTNALVQGLIRAQARARAAEAELETLRVRHEAARDVCVAVGAFIAVARSVGHENHPYSTSVALMFSEASDRYEKIGRLDEGEIASRAGRLAAALHHLKHHAKHEDDCRSDGSHSSCECGYADARALAEAALS